MKEFFINIPYNKTAIDIGTIENLCVKISKSNVSKSIGLKINFIKNCVILTYPYYISEKKALEFMQSKYDWIYSTIAKQKLKTKIQGQSGQNKIEIKDQGIISICGETYKINNDKEAKITSIENNILTIPGEEIFLNRRIQDFAKRQFKEYAYNKSKEMAKILSLKFNNISLKDTTSRWGSCSSNGNISFSYRIAFAPKYVIDYLIAHEISHLKEMNHSENFWKTVEILIPKNQIKTARNWLNSNGTLLHMI